MKLISQQLNIPKLRFPEFKEEWNISKLGDISNFSKGINISKDDIVEDGKIEAIRYGELYTFYGEVISRVVSKTNLNRNQLIFSKKNDVLIPSSGETHIDIATASCILKDGVALSGDINIISSKINGVYLAYYLKNAKKKEIARLAQGVSVIHLYSSNLKVLKVYLPSSDEQNRISELLTTADEKISKMQKKVKLLKKYKKGVIQKIFSQKIRFKDENGKEYPDWEEKSLYEIADRVTKKNNENNVTYVLTNSAVQGIVSQLDYFEKEIANQNNLLNYYIVATDDFVYNPRISTAAPVGPIKRNHLRDGVMSPLYSVFRFKSGNINFFEKYFETTRWHEYLKSVANYGARHDRMNITNEDLFALPIPYSCEEEQQRIAEFLISIDDKIQLEENKLEQAKRFKKSLLQQMFI